VKSEKRTWGALRGTWVPHDTRDAVVDFVATWSAETALPVRRFVGWLGLGASKYFDWN
jgi:putative transposase